MACFSTTATVDDPRISLDDAAFCHQLLAVVETMVPEKPDYLRGSAGALGCWSR